MTFIYCPSCYSKSTNNNPRCPACHLDLGPVKDLTELQKAVKSRLQTEGSEKADASPHQPAFGIDPSHSKDYDVIVLSSHPKELWFGRNTNNRVSIPHSSVADSHFVISRQFSDRYWIADSGSGEETFVNKRPIIAHCLADGDLIQAGQLAWVFNAEDCLLVRVGPIRGAELTFTKVSAIHLKDINCHITSGELVAIIGPSGAGKSTLIRALTGDKGTDFDGQIVVDGHDIRKFPESFRQSLGYVAQDNALQGDLKAMQVVRYAAKLRHKSNNPTFVMRQAGLPQKCFQTMCSRLSGGESKRLRLAAELVADPRLLVLDEPGSGLDEERERSMMRLLRQLSYRGCTILVVIHNRRMLEYCDRVLVVMETNRGAESHGELRFNGTPTELQAAMPNDRFDDLTEYQPFPGQDQRSQDGRTVMIEGEGRRSAIEWFSFSCRQFLTLFFREATLIRNSWCKRLLLPLLLMPPLFAVSIGLAVPSGDVPLLGFLSILACIWMGASLSVMSIVDERESFNHERLLFLKIVPYIFSKAIALGTIVAVQATFYFILLRSVRFHFHPPRGNEITMAADDWSVAGCFIGVSIAAFSMGLVVSALANRSRPAANFILPLLMMAQIVFTVHVAGNGSDLLHNAYGGFNQKPPDDWATKVSHITISRYGDIALRSFAYFPPSNPSEDLIQHYADRKHRAVFSLVTITIVSLFLSVSLLRLQEINRRQLEKAHGFYLGLLRLFSLCSPRSNSHCNEHLKHHLSDEFK